MNEEIISLLYIKSDLSEIKKVEEFLRNIFDFYNYSQNCFNKVFLCVSEAVVNAITHGNKKDKNKKVNIDINCETQIIIKVSDEGDGFNPNNIPDPTNPENLLKESGRGLHIIKNIADSVTFNNKGNVIFLEFNCK